MGIDEDVLLSIVSQQCPSCIATLVNEVDLVLAANALPNTLEILLDVVRQPFLKQHSVEAQLSTSEELLLLLPSLSLQDQHLEPHSGHALEEHFLPFDFKGIGLLTPQPYDVQLWTLLLHLLVPAQTCPLCDDQPGQSEETVVEVLLQVAGEELLTLAWALADQEVSDGTGGETGLEVGGELEGQGMARFEGW